MSAQLEFATDPIDPFRYSQAVQEFAEVQSSSRVWLLVDAALLDPDRLDSAIRRSGWRCFNALANTPLAAYGAHGPQLLEAPAGHLMLAEGVRRLASAGPTAPAFSWLASNQPVEQLQACLGYLAQARQDGLKLHCRMSDTRVLPTLLATLSAPQARRVAKAIDHWQWLDRDGLPRDWHAPPSDEGEADMDAHLELGAMQFASLLDAAEADGIFAQLLETVSRLVPRADRAAFHRQLQGILDTATGLKITGSVDRLQFVVLSLGCGDDFYKHPALSPTWEAAAVGTSLTTLMKDWSDDLWNALESRTQ